MKRSGRRSAADKYAAYYVPTLEPIRPLTPAEQRVWDSVAIASDGLVESDAILLTHYCALVCAFNESRDVNEKTKLGATVFVIRPGSQADSAFSLRRPCRSTRC